MYLNMISCGHLNVDYLYTEIQLARAESNTSCMRICSESSNLNDCGMIRFRCGIILHARTLKDLWDFIYLTGVLQHTAALKCHIRSGVVLKLKSKCRLRQLSD